MRVKPLLRLSDEPLRGIEKDPRHRRQGIHVEKASARRDRRLALAGRLERDAPKEHGIRIAPVQLQCLGEMSHRVGERTALIADEAEQ